MSYVHEWVTKAKCVGCGNTYSIDPRYSFNSLYCEDCKKANKKARIKKERKIKGIRFISFFIPPIGILLYFRWKDTKPDYAKTALKSALILPGILIGFRLLPVVINLCL